MVDPAHDMKYQAVVVAIWEAVNDTEDGYEAVIDRVRAIVSPGSPDWSATPLDTVTIPADPIAELEGMGGRLEIVFSPSRGEVLAWLYDQEREFVTEGLYISDIRAAAERLVKRVKVA